MQFSSNAGNGHLVRLPLESRRRLTASYLRASDAFLKVFAWCVDRGPTATSRAGRLKAQQSAIPIRTTSTPIDDALDRIVFAFRAGLDHARLVATALPDERASFAIVTTSRGCIESFAKAWWLMSAPSQKEITVRWLSSLERELNLRHKLEPDAVLASVDSGVERSVTSFRDVVADDLRTLLAGERPAVASDTWLASEFGNLLGPDGRLRYSRFSAVAHGESLGIGDFIGVTTGTRTPHYVVGMPAWLAEYCSETAFIASSVTAKMLIEFTGYDDSDGEVAAAHDDALVTMQYERERNFAIVQRSLFRFER
ncbi:hypothetical protein ELQ92_00045 [Labedella populi]|uniref:Uncharacterized protein n=1 Tax=Labedella populi TaxID=2498850 RepID=A0A3S5CNY8_9MICO|nr:hypothetical protein [Labedella populi]RWZ67709.1 hypothetical protein ELQ92_00045 [Labedella populi]